MLPIKTRFKRHIAKYAIAMGVYACSGVAQASPAVEANTSQQAVESRAQQQSSQSASASQVVHILVGHSLVIKTESRLKRILIGNPGVLTSTTTAPNEIVITANAPGTSSVVMWLEGGQARLVEFYADVDIAMLRDATLRTFPKEPIQVEAEEGKVVLTGIVSSAGVVDQMGKIAAPFGKDVVNSLQVAQPGRLKQVMLKVRFAEVDRAKLDTFGFNILSTGAANTVGSLTTQQFGAPTLGQSGLLSGTIGAGATGTTSSFSLSNLLNVFVYRPDLNLGVSMSDLQSKNVLQILAEPNLIAVSGEPAVFLAGGEFPYPVVQGGTAGTVGAVTIQFRPFGVKLEFTGTIGADNMIRLKVAPEVSSLDYTNAVTLNGFVLPAISTRRAETVVDLKDGQSFGIAGLLDHRTTALMQKMPGFADIPILGQLFRSKSVNKSLNELLVLVTATVVDAATPPSSVAPPLPKMPIPNIQPTQFDQKLPGTGEK